MAAPDNTSKRDTTIVVSLGILTIIATLITALPGFLSLKAKRPLITYETRTSGIAFPTNSNTVRVKQLLEKEGIPDSSFVVSLKNSGSQQALDVKISINVPGNIISFTSRPSPKDNPAWVDISTLSDSTNNPSLVTYDLKNLAVGPKFEIEVNYSSSGNGDPNCEIYSDGFQGVQAINNATPGYGMKLVSMAIFLIGSILTFSVLIILRTKERPELKNLLGLVADYLFPYLGFFSNVVKFSSKGPLVTTTKPVSSVLRFEAKDAELHGTVIQYEFDEIMDNIGYWNSKDDFATWKFQVSHPTTFSIVVEQACQKDCGGEYFIVIGSGRLPAKVVETGTWQNFTRCRVGHFNVYEPGEYILKIEPIRLQGVALMNLRTVFLHPINLK